MDSTRPIGALVSSSILPWPQPNAGNASLACSFSAARLAVRACDSSLASPVGARGLCRCLRSVCDRADRNTGAATMKAMPNLRQGYQRHGTRGFRSRFIELGRSAAVLGSFQDPML